MVILESTVISLVPIPYMDFGVNQYAIAQRKTVIIFTVATTPFLVCMMYCDFNFRVQIKYLFYDIIVEFAFIKMYINKEKYFKFFKRPVKYIRICL